MIALLAVLHVVSSIPTLGSLAKEVGGSRVDVESLGKGYQDPHFVEPKPNLMMVLNRADLLLHVGPGAGDRLAAAAGARARATPRSRPASRATSTARSAIPVLDVPTTKVDRSMGDIHPQGNPHYWLPPANAKIIAREIAERLGQLDPRGPRRLREEPGRLQRARGREARRNGRRCAAKLKGVKVVTYHKSWSYVSQWLGLQEIGYVEPKPGIPSPTSHTGAADRPDEAKTA